MSRTVFFVTSARGTEGPLRRELVELGIRGPRGAEGGVSFLGRLDEALAVCLHSRVAMRVLWELGSFSAENAEELYAGAKALDWAAHLTTGSTFAVSATVRDNPALAHSGFAALKVKDAIVDHLRDLHGARPNVDPENPDVPVVLHLRGAEAKVFLDLAGEPLHRRGYRVAMTEAPLKENLAAAILALADAKTELPLLDPMAGSGTFAIEQALRARRIAPGGKRRFAFERWPNQDHATAWADLREAARAAELPRAPAPILARDISADAIAAARRNAAAAGVAADLQFEVGPIGELTPPHPTGTLVTNPPYGERLGPAGEPSRAPGPQMPPGRKPAPFARPGVPARFGRSDRAPDRTGPPPASSPAHDPRVLARFYDEMTAALGRFAGWNLAVLSGNPAFSRSYLRKPDITHRLFNGPLETRLLVYRPR